MAMTDKAIICMWAKCEMRVWGGITKFQSRQMGGIAKLDTRMLGGSQKYRDRIPTDFVVPPAVI